MKNALMHVYKTFQAEATLNSKKNQTCLYYILHYYKDVVL